jgi:hypothetical protein
MSRRGRELFAIVDKGATLQDVMCTKREDGPTPAGGVYSVITWDHDTGNAEILEYDAHDHLICRREWDHCEAPSGADRIVGEMRTFDPSGEQLGARPIRWRPASTVDAD